MLRQLALARAGDAAAAVATGAAGITGGEAAGAPAPDGGAAATAAAAATLGRVLTVPRLALWTSAAAALLELVPWTREVQSA